MSTQQDDAADDTSADAFVRFVRAKRTNAKFAAKDEALLKDLEQIEQRKLELTTTRKMSRGQRDDWLHDLIETTFIPYSKAWNLRLARRIQNTLPPEIRSIVWSYLLDGDTWHHYECQFMATTHVLPPEIGHCCCIKMFHGLPRVPHFCLPEYMGPGAAMEIVEKLYSDRWFSDKTFHGLTTGLESLIHKDPFGADYDIVSHIRRLSVICVVDRYRRRRVWHPPNGCKHTPYQRRYTNRDQLKSEFDQLLCVIGNKAFQRLEVTFVQRNVRIDVLEEALESFVDVHKAFIMSGIDMRVKWSYSGVGECSEHLGHMHDRNLGKFFTEPRPTWKHRMLQFLKQMGPCIEPKHRWFTEEPSLGLSDNDFVHRMWGNGETFDTTDGEESEDEDSEGSDAYSGESREGFESDNEDIDYDSDGQSE